MPIYDYACHEGHVVEVQCRMDGSDAPATCMTMVERMATFDANTKVKMPCSLPLTRQIGAPSGFPGADSWRR